MAGMYPENEEVTIFGEKVQWPGVDKNGKFTNGSFSDPHEPPSFIPAGTINLILDNLSALITKLGGKPDNSSVTQLAELFTSAPQVNTGIMRDTAGRAKVAAPVEADDIARKAEVDAEVQARTQSISNLAQSFQQAINNEAQARTQGDGAISSQLSAHAGNNSNPHGVSKAQLGLGNVDNTHDNQKSVKYAATAGSAKANGGNADTVDGYHAGNGVNMLVPVVAFNVGENVGYIKLGNGLIVQWGKAASPRTSPDIDGKTGYWIRDSKYIQLPLEYSGNYSIFTQGEDTPRDKDDYVQENFLVHSKNSKGFHVTHWDSDDGWGNAVWRCNWLTIGI